MIRPLEPALNHKPLTAAQVQAARERIANTDAESMKGKKLGFFWLIGWICVGMLISAMTDELGWFFIGVIVGAAGAIGASFKAHLQYGEVAEDRRGLEPPSSYALAHLADVAEKDPVIRDTWRAWAQAGFTLLMRDVEALERFANRREAWVKERAMVERVEKIVGA